MNSFLKTLLVLGIAIVFLAQPAFATYQIVDDFLSWNFVHNRFQYTYSRPIYDIYGDIVSYRTPSLAYGQYFSFYNVYPYINFFPQSISPPTSIRNIQAMKDTQKRESEFIINENKNISSGSTSRIVSKNTTSATVIPPNQGWQQTTPKESFLDSSNSSATAPNTLFFSLDETEISCNTLGFEYDVIDVKSNESVTEHLYVKNSAGEDFFIDSVSVFENEEEFNAFGNIKDRKILENDRARVSVTVDAFEVKQDVVESIEVRVRGHFESGKSCSFERNFLVGVKGSGEETISTSSYDFSAPVQVEFEDSGFVMISLDNPTGQEIKITITTGDDAIVYPNTLTVPKNIFLQRVLAVNQATPNEFIYYTISSKGKMLEQKYTKIVFPVSEQVPVDPVFGEEGTILISSYSSKVMFVNGRADIPIVLQNTTNSVKEVVVGLSNPPQGFVFNPVVLAIGPDETKSFNLEILDNGIEDFPFNSILTVNFDGQTINREIVFEKTEVTIAEQEQELDQSGVAGFISTGFLALQENALMLGLVFLIVIILIVIISFLIKDQKSNTEVWVSEKY